MTEQQSKYVANAEQKKRPPRIPDDFLNEMEALVASQSAFQFAIGDKFLEGWEEMGVAYTEWFGGERKAHRWFLESVAASSGISPSSLRHYYRVSKHVPPDMRGGENEAFSYAHWRAMLAGDGEPEENLEENLEWAHKQLEQTGHPPSTRDIEGYVKHNGHKQPWERRAERLFTVLNAMIDDDGAPKWIRDGCQWLVDKISERLEDDK